MCRQQLIKPLDRKGCPGKMGGEKGALGPEMGSVAFGILAAAVYFRLLLFV